MVTQSNDLLISRDKLPNTERTLDSFTLFPELPAELRLMIWRAVIIPRRIGIELITSPSTPVQRYPLRHYRLFTPSPILLRINHESRSVGLPHYQALFTDTCNPAVKKYVDPKLDTIVLYKTKSLSDFPYEMLEDVISSIESLGVARCRMDRLCSTRDLSFFALSFSVSAK